MPKDLKEQARRNAIIQRRYELNYYPKVRKAIQGRISSLIEVIKSDGVSAGANWISQQIDSGDLVPVVQDLYLKVGVRFARMQYRGQKMEKKGFGLNEIWVQWIKDNLYGFLLRTLAYRVGDYTRQVLLNVLSKSIEEGWGVYETVKALEELPLSRTQAARIVRTEVTRAANAGTMAGAADFEFEQVKEWIAARDHRTRGRDPEDHASHVGLDGQVVDYDKPFIDPRNKDELMFPGDPNAKKESTINCRCSVAVYAKRDENGRMIPKGGEVLIDSGGNKAGTKRLMEHAEKFKTADEFIKGIRGDNIFPDVVQFHGTQAQSLDNPRAGAGSQGSGFYTTTSYRAAEYFGRQANTGQGREMVFDTANVFSFDMRNIKMLITNEDNYIEVNTAKARGYDAVFYEDLGETVVFNTDKLKKFDLVEFFNAVKKGAKIK